MLKNKIEGSIFGMVIGDALGSRYEFKKKQEIIQQINLDSLNSKDKFLPILGGGHFNVVAGQVTDDSELAFGLLHSLINLGTYNKEAVANKYLKWYNSKPFDIGNTTAQAFENARSYYDIIKNSEKYNKTSLSNGCLMRIAPLGIFGVFIKNELLVKFCFEDTIMTNPNTIAVDAVIVFCIAIKTALTTNDKQLIFNAAYSIVHTNLIKNILKMAFDGNPEPTILPNGDFTKTNGEHIGYLGIALQNAFFELIHGKSFYESLCNVISRGGDTDTNACITGSLLGAYYGKNNLPEPWIKSVQIHNPRITNYDEINQRNIPQDVEKLIKKFKF